MEEAKNVLEKLVSGLTKDQGDRRQEVRKVLLKYLKEIYDKLPASATVSHKMDLSFNRLKHINNGVIQAGEDEQTLQEFIEAA